MYGSIQRFASVESQGLPAVIIEPAKSGIRIQLPDPTLIEPRKGARADVAGLDGAPLDYLEMQMGHARSSRTKEILEPRAGAG